MLNALYDLSLIAPFGIKTTEAPHYQRIIWDRERQAGVAPVAISRRRQLRAPRGVTDGNGFVFIDHLGTICPNGFLPMACGRMPGDSVVEVYRHHPLFTRLRDPDVLGGKCGRCRFRGICGGSRSRAFAATGNALASDPLCLYDPGDAVEPLVAHA